MAAIVWRQRMDVSVPVKIVISVSRDLLPRQPSVLRLWWQRRHLENRRHQFRHSNEHGVSSAGGIIMSGDGSRDKLTPLNKNQAGGINVAAEQCGMVKTPLNFIMALRV